MAFNPNDWANKLQLTIDNSKVNEDLTDFPVLVTLSSGTGITNFDATAVFDELFTVSGTKKIAITTTVSGVEIELYTEIERWDWTNEQAWLWTKIPTISSGTDTNLYLYYDKNHADNSSYIGNTGDTPAKNVWDDNFVGVWHLAENGDGSANEFKDSTNNTHDGTATGHVPSQVNGIIGKAQDYDGSGDYIDVADHSDFGFGTNNWSAEFICKFESVSNCGLLALNGYSSGISIRTEEGGSNIFTLYLNNTKYDWSKSWETDIWYLITVFRNGNDGYAYINDLSLGTKDFTGKSVSQGTVRFGEVLAGATSGKLDGILDEIRISNLARSDAWRKATYYSNWDNFVTFSEYEVGVTFTFTNPSPAHQSTVYGNSQTLQLTVTVSGEDPPYTYDATFYNATTSGVISTVSGINSGQSVSTNWSTVDSGDYGWYLTATSSGYNDTSSTYEFIKKYKCEGYVEIDGTRASGVPVRLYRRNTGELIGYTTSAGISGTFEIETIYNENHYAVAVHPTDSGTNALIYDWINP